MKYRFQNLTYRNLQMLKNFQFNTLYKVIQTFNFGKPHFIIKRKLIAFFNFFKLLKFFSNGFYNLNVVIIILDRQKFPI